MFVLKVKKKKKKLTSVHNSTLCINFESPKNQTSQSLLMKIETILKGILKKKMKRANFFTKTKF